MNGFALMTKGWQDLSCGNLFEAIAIILAVGWSLVYLVKWVRKQ